MTIGGTGLVVNGSINLPFRFGLSGALQAYSSPPFNIVTGATTIQGTAGRPVVNGEFIERNAGVGSRFFTASAKLSRSFAVAGPVELEGALEAFNVTNHKNAVARNTNFGPGAFPTSPAAGFGDVTAVADPRTLQLAIRLRF